MTLEGLQAALQRIHEIRSRFEAVAPATPAGGNDGGPSFDALLSNVMEKPNATLPVPEALEGLIQDKASQHGLDPDLLKALIRNESGFNPKARSPVGAEGLMQLMPGTAKGLGVTNSLDPAQNIDGGARYLKGLLKKYDQSVPLALAAYNAGPGAVDRHGGIPPYAETTQYVKKVMQSYKAYDNAGHQPAARVGLAGTESRRDLGTLDTSDFSTQQKTQPGGLE
ncbi:MAG TPA: lytic transglycosylase domain-containing protein [Coleofasciculaceae cyanobacterium]